ncbi:MAG: polysaccharide biosynthesis/export family protein [Clostridium sp.]|nr:polysaccharide biosynthesis/export family protein [Bacteroides sp.]MCM1199089.1 polysaccharide biosynthesis/export family protein [Clostridium sp.]
MKLFSGFLKVALTSVLMLFVASCSTYKKINYLQDLAPDSPEAIAINKGILIQPKDMISIVVSSKNPELAATFNLPVVSYQAGAEITSSSTGQQRLLGYVVDNDGNIDFPILGEMHVAGLTRWELSKQIKKMLIDQDYIKDPVVTVQFMNFKISVIGEVTRPNTYSIDGDKITILEALSLAGDLTIFGKRDNVTVIREQNGERVMHQLDLRSVELFNSPAYYLQQNDVVYVTPNAVRAGQSTINENNIKSVSMWVTISSFLATLATLIITASPGHSSGR